MKLAPIPFTAPAPTPAPVPAGKYIFLTLFLAVTLEAFEAKYDALAVRAGMKQGGLSSIFSKLSSRFSSFGNSFKR